MRAVRCVALCLLFAFSASSFAASKPPQNFVVTGYVFARNRPLEPGQIDAQRLQRINYAFANIEGGRMVLGAPIDAQNFATLAALRREHPSLTVLVSVGGWLWSTHFSDVALTAESRRVFIESAMDFLKLYDLDGLDVDWEYPGMVGAGNPFRSEDKQNFTLLMKELRRGSIRRRRKPTADSI